MRNIFGYGSFGGRSSFMGADPASPEETMGGLSSLANQLEGERSQDASDFQAMTAAGKRRLDLVYVVKRAEDTLATETKKWEASHLNADALQAAQQALDNANAQYDQAKTDVDTYREAVNHHATVIQSLFDQIEGGIASLPDEKQAQARAMVEACRLQRTLSGSDTCIHGESELGCKKCQRGRKKKQYKNPFAMPSGILKAPTAPSGFLGEVSLYGMGQGVPAPIPTPAPTAAPAPAAAPTPDSGFTPLQIGIGAGILALAVGFVVFSR